MGSLVDNRPAKRGPSLGQCRGRWTQRQNRWGDHRRKRVIRTAGTRRRDSEPGHWVMPKVARYQERHRDRKRKAGRKAGGAGKETAARQSSTTLSVLLIPKGGWLAAFFVFAGSSHESRRSHSASEHQFRHCTKATIPRSRSSRALISAFWYEPWLRMSLARLVRRLPRSGFKNPRGSGFQPRSAPRLNASRGWKPLPRGPFQSQAAF